MNFYKVLSGAEIIDANCVFLKWQSKNDILLACEITEAHFIQSSDGGTIWRADWLNRLPDGFENSRHYPVETVEAVEISAEDYEALKEQLDLGPVEESATDEPQNTEDSSGDDTDSAATEEVMSAAAMRLKIQSLESTVAALAEQNDMLTECLLEMSEVVYA